jgi:hypothetical protein
MPSLRPPRAAVAHVEEKRSRRPWAMAAGPLESWGLVSSRRAAPRLDGPRGAVLASLAMTNTGDGSAAASPASFGAWTSGFGGQTHYRAYAQSGDLYFVSYPAQSKLQLVLMQFGLLGALIWLFFKKGFEQKTAALLASYDNTPPADLVLRDKSNFVATPARMTEQTVEPAGFFKRGASAAQWQFTHPERGKVALNLSTPADVEAVLGLLARAPAARADVQVRWDDAKKKYVARS